MCGRMDGMDGRTHGRRQNYIPPTSSGDNKIRKTNTLHTPFRNSNELHFLSAAVCDYLNCYIVGCGFFNVLFS